MPAENVTDRRCCHKCHTTVAGKRKLSKCAQCHSITYCGPECQREDWPRHSQYCIPVMVIEIPGKGKGLVASKDFKKGQVLFKETAAITVHAPSHIVPLQELKEQVSKMSEEQKTKFYQLTSKGNFNPAQIAPAFRDNCLVELDIFFSNSLVHDGGSPENKFLFITSSLLNHSCAPNVLLEGRSYSSNEVKVIAIKDISKGEEVTEYYMTKGMMTKSQRREIILGAFSFDCKCSVCVGLISDQDGIISEIVSINAKRCLNLTYQMKTEDWMTEALKFERAADLTRKLDVGHILDRISVIMNFVRVSQMARDPIRLKKAMDLLKGEADAAGCWSQPEAGYKTMVTSLEKWSTEFKSKKNPRKAEIKYFYQSHSIKGRD